VPIFALPVDEDGAANSGMLIDLLGNSTVDEDGIVWWWFLDLYLDAAVLTLGGDLDEPIPAGAELPDMTFVIEAFELMLTGDIDYGGTFDIP